MKRRNGWWSRAITVLAIGSLAACGGSGDGAAVDRGSGSGNSAADSAAMVPGETPVVLFIGTSLTAGLGLDPDSAFPQLIQHKIDSAGLHYTVVNAGVSGETSAGLLRRLDWLMRGDFDVVVLETGANDGLRGLPVADTKRNIQAIVDTIQKTHAGAQVILVQMEAPPNLGVAYTSAFHQMYPDIAADDGLVLMPFLLDGVAGDRELNQGDGIHPNQEGERIVAENVWTVLEPVLRGSEG